ncbi:MAG: poly-gamma-glutamate hydrolase family protein [Elusimicrobia bacterium]|nr:poly-gamma-glutamate hydrolase family protein [Elusimicrobiota bacterium]MDA8244827.1 poly-gamma-glutamate hydrolase family protein [Elusimicrobiota bacterium]
MKTLLPLAILLLSACSAGPAALRRGGDAYPDFSAMRAAYAEGADYSREVYPRGSAVSVFAMHGGDIEDSTARVARRIAGKDFNLYVFSGWLGPDSSRMHVTSTHFDDPDAVLLATSSVLGISVHAEADSGARVCVGGSNRLAAGLVTRRLQEAGFAAETPCERLPGTSPKNLVNLPSSGGVQLELTLRLLGRLERDREALAAFSGAVRMAASEFVSSESKSTGENK